MPSEKKKPIVTLEPANELQFTIPSEGDPARASGVTAHLVITNPSDDAVMFKVKTTAPRKYCVKPNSGELLAKSNVTVKVVLQAAAFPSATEQCKDKFLVQTVLRADTECEWDKDTVWKETSSKFFMENKMRCRWLLDGQGSKAAPVGTTARTAEREPAPAKAASSKATAAAVTEAAPRPTKPATSGSSLKNSSSAPAKKNLSEPVATIKQSKPAASTSRPSSKSSSKATAVATVDQSKVQQANMYLLIIAFIFGVICGKFLI